MKKKAVITGICGQDGSYLAEFLLGKGYDVVGVHRRSSSNTFGRLSKIKDQITLVEGDITDMSFIYRICEAGPVDEIYNLAAQSHVASSFKTPIYTTEVNYIGCLNFLEYLADRKRLADKFNNSMKITVKIPKFYQASTSEMFGSNYTVGLFNAEHGGAPAKNTFGHTWGFQMDAKYQDEDTPFSPNSPYAIAKLAAHNAVKVYREAYGIHASCGILFNHESPRRGDEFVTKKITNYVREFKAWKDELDKTEEGGYDLDYELTKGYISVMRQNKLNRPYGHKDAWLCGSKFPKLHLGNIQSRRDWGYAPDYVEGMWLMLQQEKPDDYVLATGETHTVDEFLQEAFKLIVTDCSPLVEIDSTLNRPSEVPYLRGSYTKALDKLGWKPKVKFKELVKIMVENDS